MTTRTLDFIGTASPRRLAAMAGGACMTVAWLVPNHYPPWGSFYNECVMGLALLLLAASAAEWGSSFGLTTVAWAVTLIASIPWLQWINGQLDFSGDAWISSLYLLGLATAIQVGYRATRTGLIDLAELLSTAVLAAALASTAIAATQCFDLAGSLWLVEIPFGTRGTANLAQPNNLMTLIGLGGVGLWQSYENRRVGPILGIAALVILLIGATLTQSRTGLLFLPSLMLLRFAMQGRLPRWRLPWQSLVLALCLQFALLVSWPPARQAIGLASSISLSNASLASGRWAVWPVLVDGALQRPWLGYGWLKTGAAQLAVAERHPQFEELFLQAHNLILDLVIWCGLPLGLALGGLLVYWLVTRAKEVSCREAAFGLMSVVLFGIHAMLELPHHYAYFLLPIGLWVGLIEADRGSRAVGPRTAPAALTVATGCLAVALIQEYPRVEEDFRLIRFESLSIGSLRASQPAPDAPLLSSLTAYLRVMREPVTDHMSSSQVAELVALARRYPYSPVLYREAKAFALNGKLACAQRVLEKLRHIHGEMRYQAVRASLREEIADGQGALTALSNALPP